MKSLSEELVDRAVSAMLGAIELYNKPIFSYRMEAFTILAINSWELLLKAKWLNQNGDKMDSLYVFEQHKGENEEQGTQSHIKKTRAGAPFTHSIDWLAKKLNEQKKLDTAILQNLLGLIEIRDASIHFYSDSQDFKISLYKYGAACVMNFITALREWFKQELSELGLYLLPLAFVELPTRIEGVTFNAEEISLLRFLDDIDKTQEEPDTPYSVTVNVDIKFTKSTAKDALAVRATNDPEALEVCLSEEQIREKYPWDYGTLIPRCKERYSDFKQAKKFYDIKKSLMANGKYAHIRYLDLNNKKGQKKPFFNPSILQELDKHYTKK
jgi:hypothetical protein